MVSRFGWDGKKLSVNGPIGFDMLMDIRPSLQTQELEEACEDLYRFSNQLWGKTLDNNWKDISSSLKVGERFKEATIIKIEKYGAWLRIPNQDQAFNNLIGFVHNSQIPDPEGNEPPKVGDKREVVLIGLDSRRQRIDLSMIMPEDRPATKFEVGQIIKGEISRLENYGVFVRLDEEVEGLVRSSEIYHNVYDGDWSKVFNIGDLLSVKILEIDAAGKVGLTSKLGENDPLKKYTEGSVVEGIVTKIIESGAFVDLEPGISGRIYIGEIADKFVKDISEELEVGEKVTVRILKIDWNSRKIDLSMRQV